jgi:hypothetical protein
MRDRFMFCERKVTTIRCIERKLILYSTRFVVGVEGAFFYRRHFVIGASLSALECARVMGANDHIGVAVVGCGMLGLLGE